MALTPSIKRGHKVFFKKSFFLIHAFYPGKKAPQTCPTSVKMTNWMSKKYNAVIPIGSELCTNHLKEERSYIQKGVRETIEEDSTNSSKQVMT